MKIFYSNTQKQHRSPFEIWNGGQDQHQEVPERAETILKALRQSNQFQIEEVSETLPMNILKSIHTPEYITYLEETCRSLKETEYRYPSVFTLRDSESQPTNALALQGYYSFDMYTPLLRHTYEAALSSATLAWKVADAVQMGKMNVGYALCRPPGHHAERDQMGGYCYFNNAGVSAEYLSQFGKVATLDVDFHHGNGTQHIFYDRDDVLTVSLHADPEWKFPHMSGYENEIGGGKGKGFNKNYCLQKGTSNEQFQKTLESACEEISDFKPQFLVVSFGADTYEGDPIGGFALTTEYFTQMARTIHELGLPTVIVQEGGYNCDELGTNVVSFLGGFEN